MTTTTTMVRAAIILSLNLQDGQTQGNMIRKNKRNGPNPKKMKCITFFKALHNKQKLSRKKKNKKNEKNKKKKNKTILMRTLPRVKKLHFSMYTEEINQINSRCSLFMSTILIGKTMR